MKLAVRLTCILTGLPTHSLLYSQYSTHINSTVGSGFLFPRIGCVVSVVSFGCIDKVVWFFPRYFTRNFVKVIWRIIVCVAENPFFVKLRVLFRRLFQKLTIFKWHIPSYIFCNRIPIVRVPRTGICALCPICMEKTTNI